AESQRSRQSGRSSSKPKVQPIRTDLSECAIIAAACGSVHTLLLARPLKGGEQQVFICGAWEALGLEGCYQDQSEAVDLALEPAGDVTAIAARAGASCCASSTAGFSADAAEHLLFFWGEVECSVCPNFFAAPAPCFRIPEAVKAVSLGGCFGLALDTAGVVYAWGDGTYGELGGADPVDLGTADPESLAAGKLSELPTPGRVILPKQVESLQPTRNEPSTA
ncbi:unnamed protein product, partial [Polarella glacialis]